LKFNLGSSRAAGVGTVSSTTTPWLRTKLCAQGIPLPPLALFELHLTVTRSSARVLRKS